MGILENQILQLRNSIELIKLSQVSVFYTEPKNPNGNSIWIDQTQQALKIWDGSNWLIAGGGSGNTFALDVVFTIVDYNTISWADGTISLGKITGADSYAISNGSFDVTTTTYFYWQKDNPNAIQTTITPVTAVEAGGILIAIAKPNSDTAKKAEFKIFGGEGGNTIINGADSIIAGSITTTQLGDDAVTASKLSVASIDGITGNLVANSVGTTQITDDAVTSQKIVANAIIAGKIAAGVITATEIAALTITGAKIAAGTITAANILAGTITANEIATGTITSVLIAANTIVAGNIAANTITANKLSITTLSAITADMGSITAGTITLNTSGYIKGGQTAYDTGTGFFLGYSTSAYKFSIGNSAGSKMTWDGTNLAITGQITTASGSSIDGSYLGNGTVTAGKISVSSLSAISANIGTITAGTITGVSINSTVNSSDQVACHMDSSSSYGFYVDQVSVGKMISITAVDDGGYRGVINIYDGGSYCGRMGGVYGSFVGLYVEADTEIAYGYDFEVVNGTTLLSGKLKIPVGTNLF